MYRFICLLLLTPGIGNALKISKGGTNRGSSAARLNPPRLSSHSLPGGYQPQRGAYQPQPGAYQPQPGAYHPEPGAYHSQQSGYRSQQNEYHRPASGDYHPSQAGGYHQQGGFAPNQMKPSGRGTFGKAVLGGALGAAAGLATFELGKAILRSASEPLRASNGQNYYFDEQNHQSKNGYFMCSMLINDVVKTLQGSSTPVPTTDESINSTAMSPEQFFKTVGHVQFKDGSRPKSLTWNCKTGTEICCGTDCCPIQQQFIGGGNFSHRSRPSWVVFVSFLLSLVPFCY
uniref:CX domain-containing protein n=1 Tax=Loa loa TaxID=7209 RepID=A0A1I7VT69_LOALO